MRLVRRRLPAAVIAAVAAVALSAGCGSSGDDGSSSSSTAGAGGDIKIGAIYDLSGPLSALGVPESKGAQAYVDALNAAGGINGRKVDLIIQNGQSTTDAAVSAARELIQKGVVAILGPPSGATAKSVLPIVNAAKIPTLSHQGSFDATEGYLFTNTLAGSRTTQAFADYMKAHGVKTVGLLVSSDANGQAQAQLASKLFTDIGLTIASKQTIDPTGTDYTTQLSALKSANVDAVMSLGSGAPNVVAVKGFKALNMKGNIYLLNASVDQLPTFGDAGSSIIVPQPKVAVADQIAASDSFKPLIDSFISAVKPKGVPIDLFGAEGYDGARILTDVIKAVGSDPAKIYNKMNDNFTDDKHLAGAIHWTPNDHGCCALNAWVAATVDGGKFKVLGPWGAGS